MSTPDPAWLAANQAWLAGLFETLHRRLVVLAGEAESASPPPDLARLRAALPAPPGLERLAALFGLDPFATDLVALAAACELDGRVVRRLAALDGGRGGGPTVAAAFRVLPGAHWSALGPAAPLRRWRLVEVEGEGPFTARTLRLEERVLHALLGAPAVEPRLAPFLRPVPEPPALSPSRAAAADRAAAALAEGLAVVLAGRDPAALADVAGVAARRAGLALLVFACEDPPAERDLVSTLLAREARLAGSAVVLDAAEAPDEATRWAAALAQRLEAPVIVLARHAPDLRGRASLRLDLPSLPPAERAAAWRAALGRGAVRSAIAPVAGQFDLPDRAIAAAARRARRRPRGVSLGEALWQAAREACRPRLDDLAERVESRAGWDDLILPPAQAALLRAIARQVRHRAMVYDAWGFRERLSARGLGITALFAGPSGTGKTLAAEVIAGDLGLDLYRIDLSAVVSKYIGETEKNLRRIFDAAEAGGAVLLFDEADALFGKRSEVKDSHDRYANIEVGYLLQRMESYGGLAILTTNMKGNLDQAFLRRLRFLVEFPFPGPAEREAIWARVLPPALPREGVEPARLARMNLAGGAIRNVALNAAFLAAADGGVLRPCHLLAAARAEYAKLEKPLTDAELRGWAEAAAVGGAA